ncbi:DUF397 domain-containing protein [Streptomyces zingiberis]|uniref:DUF397 domain-containing protein n=1 Tax=Streptomyces zingiberis TaxID=2053010 RepID=A0ABX1C226_9ACTN|nr:DUF397 domain-containing protein [Streptomyces zingiberis]NJQ03891.1 DUF397 domain-containing protein [Streptomyces zingiberis]
MSATELTWFKSSYSGSAGDDCVEVAIAEQTVHIRDSKSAPLPHLIVDRDGWTRFLRYAAEH